MYPMFIYSIGWKMREIRNRLRKKHKKSTFLADESGMGTVEIILIIVVLIGLVIIFKKQLTSLVNTIFEAITSKSNDVLG
jgi:Flp pilus assembly pilin Flp